MHAIKMKFVLSAVFLHCHFEFQNKMATFEDDYCVRVENESHIPRLSSGLDRLRQQATFCDVNIVVGDQQFPAHKAVLSSASDYFQGMFSSGFQESTMSEVTLPGTEESFAQILDFAYTGHLTLSLQTVTDILKMACYMVFTDAVELCAAYLIVVKNQLTFEDCFEIWSIASNHSGLSDVAQLYRSHLLQNFSKCIESTAFLENSSASVMMDFLSDEEVESDDITEEHILQAVLAWLKFDWEQRKVHVVDLLKKIRLGLVPHEGLKEILGDVLLAIPECKDMVEEVIKLSASRETTSPPLIKSHPELFATRNTIRARLYEVYDLDQGDDGGFKKTVFCETNEACYEMNNLAELPNRSPYPGQQRRDASLFVSNENHLYAAVDICYYGQDDENRQRHAEWVTENNFFQYIPEKNEWRVLPPMPKRVKCPKMFHIEEYIYMIGPIQFGDVGLIQRFSILSNIWEVLVDNILFSPYEIDLIPTGQVLMTGEQQREGPTLDGSHEGLKVIVVALYKPDINELLDISVDGTLDGESDLVVYDNKCFERRPGSNGEEYQVNRLICNFDSDKPTIEIAEATEDETFAVINMSSYPEFTFDKRKLGLEERDW